MRRLLSINEIYYIKTHDEHRGHAIDNGSTPAVAPIIEGFTDWLKVVMTEGKFSTDGIRYYWKDCRTKYLRVCGERLSKHGFNEGSIGSCFRG